MGLTLRHYPLTAGVASRTDLNEDLADIVAKFGSVDNSDISATANIAVTKLAAYYQEWTAHFMYFPDVHGVWPAVGATAPLIVVPIPGQNNDTAWTVTDVVWHVSDTGSVAGSFDIRYGNYDGSGNWANTGSVTTGVSMTVIADGKGNQGRSSRLGVTVANSSTPLALALMSAGQGTGVLSTGATPKNFLHISVRLRRALQSI